MMFIQLSHSLCVFVVQALQVIVLLTLQECVLVHRESSGYRQGNKEEGKCRGFF